MIIDAHVHLWPPRRPEDEVLAWPGQAEPDDLDAAAERLIAQMDAHGVARAIVVQTPWRHTDDSYLLHVAARFAGRLTPVGCLPLYLNEADFAHETTRLGANGLAGVRLHVIGPDALEIFQSDAADGLYRKASEAGLPVLFLSRTFAAFEVYAGIAAAWPDLKMVIEHMGHATANFGGTPADLDGLMALSSRPNIRVKLAIHHQHSQRSYPWADLHALQHRFIAEFGAPRLMWGSNWPMKLPDPSYTERLETMSRHFPFRNEEDRAWVMGGTAKSLWPAAGPAEAPETA